MTGPAQAVNRPPPAPPEDPAWTVPSLAARPARLSVIIVTSLVDGIVSGLYGPGRLLPPEPALCRSFHVSRSVVREAIKVLEEKGLVTVQQGYGTVVASADDWNLLDPIVLAAVVRHDAERDVIDGLIEVRATLEAGMAARAARLRTEEDLQKLRSLMGELEGALAEVARYRALDTRFHDELMRISRNRLARAIVQSIHQQARSSAGYNEYTVEDLRLTHRGHAAILVEVEAGTHEGAAEAMYSHIIVMWRRKRTRPIGSMSVE